MQKNIEKTVTKLLKTESVEELAKFLNEANIAYRNTSKPLISDDTYDLLEERLRKLDPKHPFLKKIGAVPADDIGNKVKLPYWMGSLDKIRDDPKAIDKWKSTYTGDSLISDKLDGNSALVSYVKGVATLYSRGDGKMGQNISHLISFLKFPILHNEDVAIRGEIIISKDNWKIIHDTHPEYANARNLVAGILHSKKPDESVAKYIDFVAYELIKGPKIEAGAASVTPSQSIEYIKSLGFKTVYTRILSQDELTVERLTDILVERRKDSPYDIDGIVVYNNKIHKLASGKNPKYAFAFKSMLTHTEAEVIVNDVIWNISKDGYYKPTVTFDTITLGGVNIQKATGFNALFIEKNKIGKGAHIIIIRSGDVIPHILRVLSPASDGKPSFPEGGPSGPGGPHGPKTSKWEWNESHVDIMVKSDEGASLGDEQKLKVLEHFAKTLDIKFVAKGTLVKMIEAGFDTIPKFFKIKSEDLLKLEGFKKTSSEKIAKSIADTFNNATCVDMMAASNIFGRGFGTRKLTSIIKEIPEILRGKTPTLHEMKEIDGIAETSAKAFLQALPKFFILMNSIPMECRAPGAPIAAPAAAHVTEASAVAPAAAAVSFKDMKIIFTGFRNKDWEKQIELHEGKVTTSVSKNTTLLVASDVNEKSSKIEKARELGIKIISKETFEKDYNL